MQSGKILFGRKTQLKHIYSVEKRDCTWKNIEKYARLNTKLKERGSADEERSVG